MNKLLLALLLLPMIVKAEAIAETRNSGGGKIVLTNEACNQKGFKLAYTMMNGASTLLGCWGMDSSFIHIRWYDGDLRSYPLEGWIILKNTQPTM